MNYLNVVQSDDVNKISKLISQKSFNNVSIGVSRNILEYFQDNNGIKFPYRIHYIGNLDEFIVSLKQQQKMIVYCIYSRIVTVMYDKNI
ncbi:hypothetical protein SAMN05216389_10158 [Oceanobacillus limi]|uniref:Uncharacterized protein n=1 Tax=Oceanobacillus limi TaxID=930131 RepID=A0A1H9XZW2_9BACI|nr:hypothetical protein [Oceanobacillus limi]SES61899.1 hypothetical protein SAMN05216389_10158 [Oceanobacillus limi]